MSEQTESFISHLVELRDRLLRAVAAIVIVFICLMPWAGDIYDLLARPLMIALPEGTKMIATGVVTPFFVPVNCRRSRNRSSSVTRGSSSTMSRCSPLMVSRID